MSDEIKPGAVYTTHETQELLKVSKSTIKRMLKGGLIRANKIGGQYRILGHELLILLSPEIERKAARQYFKLKRNVVRKIRDW